MPIELSSVSYTYAPDTPYAADALNSVSLKIKDGEFVGIIGRTGCGKSTLIQIMDGLLEPASGKVMLDDKDINAKAYNRDALRKSVGVVFQFPEYQLFETTVKKDIAFALKHFGLTKTEVNQAVHDALEMVGFDYDKVCDKSPLSFSGGERRKLAIAGVLVLKPRFLILDEPVAGLDAAGRKEFLTLLNKLNANGTAVIMVSHNLDVLAEYAKRIILMKNGCIVKDGTAAEILSDSDLLADGGLKAGQVQKAVQLLQKSGVRIQSDIIKYNQLLDAVSDLYGGAVNDTSS